MGRMYSTALSLFSPLLAWYNRNPTSGSLIYQGFDVAPHASAVRVTYTVPSTRKAFITFSSAIVTRKTAATALGEASCVATPANARIKDNTVGAKMQKTVGWCEVRLAGETISITTYDGSTGGTCDYDGQVTYCEFSA